VHADVLRDLDRRQPRLAHLACCEGFRDGLEHELFELRDREACGGAVG